MPHGNGFPSRVKLDHGPAHGTVLVSGWPLRNESSFFMMNHTDGWMGGWGGGGMWLWPVLGTLLVVLLVVAIMKVAKK